MGKTLRGDTGDTQGKRKECHQGPGCSAPAGSRSSRLAPTNPQALRTSLPAVAITCVAWCGWGSPGSTAKGKQCCWRRQGGREARDPPETRPSSPETGWETGEDEGPEGTPCYCTTGYQRRPEICRLDKCCPSGPQGQTCTCGGDRRAGNRRSESPCPRMACWASSCRLCLTQSPSSPASRPPASEASPAPLTAVAACSARSDRREPVSPRSAGTGHGRTQGPGWAARDPDQPAEPRQRTSERPGPSPGSSGVERLFPWEAPCSPKPSQPEGARTPTVCTLSRVRRPGLEAPQSPETKGLGRSFRGD